MELEGLKLGIVGFGRIGRRVAAIARAFASPLFATGIAGNDAAGVLYAVSQGLFGPGELYELDAQTGTVLRSELAASSFPTWGVQWIM